MKVALVFDGLQVGGVERVGADYAKLFINLGHDVTIINLNPKLQDMNKEFPKECDFINFTYPRKLAPEQYAKLVRGNLAMKFLYPIMALILGLLNIIYKFYARLVIRKKVDLLIAFSGHFNDLSFVRYGYISHKKKLAWLHGALYSYLLISDGYINLYKKIKNLIVLVDDAQEEVLAYNKKLKINIYKLYNPTNISQKNIDTARINEIKENFGSFIVMVSRFSYPHKDHYTVANAFKKLVDKYNVDANLLFIGDGPEESKVKAYVKEFDGKISDRIYFLGKKDDVQNYYNAATLLVHASVAGEGLPTIMLEALAYDLPMVVTDSKTGPREILGNDEFGLLCKVQNPDDMAEKIYKLMNDKNLYNYYKTNSKVRLKDFEPEVIQDKLNLIVNELMNGEI